MKTENLLLAYLLIVSLLLMSACKSDPVNGYKLKVEGKGLTSAELKLLIFSDHRNSRPEPLEPDHKTDTGAEFTGRLQAPAFAVLKFGDKQTERFVLSNSKVTLELDTQEAKLITVDGGVQQDSKDEYDRIMQTDQKNQLSEELRNCERGSDEYKAVLAKIRSLSIDDVALQVKFIEDHPGSIMAPYSLWRIYSGIKEDEAIRLFHHIDTSLQQQAQYVFISRTIKAWEETAVGSNVPDLSQNSPAGETISLSDFRGNYLLIDFWASWCSPCREANPHMVEIYKKYHDKGIEFLGVSLDKNGDDWLKAIKDDGLTWPQVSDLKYWDNEISRSFGINSIPATVLIDPEGRIVAKKLHGDELERKLVELFNN